MRTRMEAERHTLILEMLKLNKDYKPPIDYKYGVHVTRMFTSACRLSFFFFVHRPPSTKITDKVFIPQEDHPDINFVGLLIGPRGKTLKELEKDVSLAAVPM